MNNKPIHEIRLSSVKAAVWMNSSATGTRTWSRLAASTRTLTSHGRPPTASVAMTCPSWRRSPTSSPGGFTPTDDKNPSTSSFGSRPLPGRLLHFQEDR